MLCADKKFIPNLLPYLHSAYSTDSILLWGNDRHDNFIGGYLARRLHIGAFLFCLAIQDLVSSLRSEYNIFYLNDGTLESTLEDLSAELKYIEEVSHQLGLCLNVAKSELIASN